MPKGIGYPGRKGRKSGKGRDHGMKDPAQKQPPPAPKSGTAAGRKGRRRGMGRGRADS